MPTSNLFQTQMGLWDPENTMDLNFENKTSPSKVILACTCLGIFVFLLATPLIADQYREKILSQKFEMANQNTSDDLYASMKVISRILTFSSAV